MSRQSEQQKVYIANGNCCICNKPRNLYRRYCDQHAALHRAYERKRTGYKPRVEGGRGRKLLSEKEVQS